MTRRPRWAAHATGLLSLACGPAGPAPDPRADLIEIPGGSLFSDVANGGSERVRRVVRPFRIMRHEVTNGMFEAFVRRSGHVTDAERSGWGWVWNGSWRPVEGADWRHPHGPDDDLSGRAEHPAVQISARDAAAFCRHYGLRLPTENEWGFAARGTDGRRYPWGDGPLESADGVRLANFGSPRCCAPDASDGWLRTAPVGRFPAGASPFGLLDMAGNVWEWTASHLPGHPDSVSLRGGGWGNDARALTTACRHVNPPDIGLDMVGFRCAADP